jgi:hypothetical protein
MAMATRVTLSPLVTSTRSSNYRPIQCAYVAYAEIDITITV